MGDPEWRVSSRLRNEIDEVLSVSVARYDPAVLSQTTKNDLAVFRDVLNQTIQKLQEEQ